MTENKKMTDLSVELLNAEEIDTLCTITDKSVEELHTKNMGALFAGIVTILETRNPTKEEDALIELRIAKYKENKKIPIVELKEKGFKATKTAPKAPKDYKKKKTS